MKTIRTAFDIIRDNRRAYIVLNILYYGLIVCAAGYVFSNPELQKNLLSLVGTAFNEGPLQGVVSAYSSGQVIQASVSTFIVNLILGSAIWITLPSLIVPFSGVLTGAYRAIMWGLLFSPASPAMDWKMIPHWLTIILEGQAYILAMFAAYVQGKAFLFPRSVGVSSHLRGYWLGLGRSARLYVLVIITLAVSAIYEAVEVILMMRFVSG